MKEEEEKRKRHTFTSIKILSEEERVKAERERSMDCREHEVAMVNMAMEEKFDFEVMVEEQRGSMERF